MKYENTESSSLYSSLVEFKENDYSFKVYDKSTEAKESFNYLKNPANPTNSTPIIFNDTTYRDNAKYTCIPANTDLFKDFYQEFCYGMVTEGKFFVRYDNYDELQSMVEGLNTSPKQISLKDKKKDFFLHNMFKVFRRDGISINGAEYNFIKFNLMNEVSRYNRLVQVFRDFSADIVLCGPKCSEEEEQQIVSSFNEKSYETVSFTEKHPIMCTPEIENFPEEDTKNMADRIIDHSQTMTGDDQTRLLMKLYSVGTLNNHPRYPAQISNCQRQELSTIMDEYSISNGKAL